MTLLAETLEDIGKSGHKIEDIVFIGSEGSGHSCTWEEFTALADHEYDNDFGAAKVATDLKIVFSDGCIMCRGEYNGAEWWEYQTPFKMPENKKPIKSVFTQNVGWDDLSKINEGI